MFTALAELQIAVVLPLLDQANDIGPWQAIFVHAEFGDASAVMQSLTEALLVPDTKNPLGPVYFPLIPPVGAALRALRAAYADAGHPFCQLDLTVNDANGRYHFEFSDDRSLRVHGEPDPEADARLLQRFNELAGISTNRD